MDNFSKKYGPWAAVTGASSGIGEEFSWQLAAQKINLVLVARREKRLDALAKKLVAKHHIEVKVVSADLSKLDSIERIKTATASLDVGLLVNNAGFALTGDFLDHNIEDELSLLYVNCRAPLVLSHFFGKHMVKNKKGGIINVSSISAFMPLPFWSHYSASKAYDLYLSEGLWFELKDHGVDVLALCPGGTRTEFTEVAGTKEGGMEPALVVESALQNLGKKSSIVPGLGNRFIVLLTKLMPAKRRIKLGAKVVKSMEVS